MIGFFEEAEGVRSSMRLYCFISLLTAVFLSVWMTVQEIESFMGAYTASLFLLAAFAPKHLSKIVELRFRKGSV